MGVNPVSGEITIGKLAVLLAASSAGDEEQQLMRMAEKADYKYFKGRVGSMDPQKIFAAIETAAKRRALVLDDQYREEHALYHSILDAFHGVCRGEVALGSILRSAGLLFSIVRGPRLARDYADGEWLAVALYGTIGAPIKGFEHEAMGLGISHI
jgi:hut operon positive regulator